MPLPAIDIATLLDDEEENLRPEQINVTHVSIMDLLGDPGNPLYAKPHSMAEHLIAMTGAEPTVGDLPSRGHCRDMMQPPVCMRRRQSRLPKDSAEPQHESSGWGPCRADLPADTHPDPPLLHVSQSCTMTLTPRGSIHPSSRSEGREFMQPRGDIRTSIVPRDFRMLPADVREVVDQYFHWEDLERRVDRAKEEDMSTDTEAADTVRQL